MHSSDFDFDVIKHRFHHELFLHQCTMLGGILAKVILMKFNLL